MANNTMPYHVLHVRFDHCGLSQCQVHLTHNCPGNAPKVTQNWRRGRRCGPQVGRTRGTSLWCPPALPGVPETERGVSVPTLPAKHHGAGSPLRLLLLSPGPHNVHTLPPYTLLETPKPPGARSGGARQGTGCTSGTVHHLPSGRGTQSHGCGPLACQVLPTGRRLGSRSRGLGP